MVANNPYLEFPGLGLEESALLVGPPHVVNGV
jgi:hypothetical protein